MDGYTLVPLASTVSRELQTVTTLAVLHNGDVKVTFGGVVRVPPIRCYRMIVVWKYKIGSLHYKLTN